MEGFSTDADRFSVAADSQGTVRSLYLRGSSLAQGNDVVFKSVKPVSASVVYVPGGADVEVEAASDTEIAVSMAKPQSKVTSTGSQTSGVRYDATAKLLSVKVAAGHTVIEIR